MAHVDESLPVYRICNGCGTYMEPGTPAIGRREVGTGMGMYEAIYLCRPCQSAKLPGHQVERKIVNPRRKAGRPEASK